MATNTTTRLSELVDRISGVGIDTAKDGKSEELFGALAEEAAKLRESDAVATIPVEKLILFLNVLQETVNSGLSNAVLVSERSEDDVRKKKTQSPGAMPATNAALLIVNILLSTNKFKETYSHDTLEKVIFFLNCQLNEFVLPYWACNKIKFRENRSRSQNKDKNILPLYDKIVQIVSLLTEIVTRDPSQSSHIPVEVFNLCLSVVLVEKSYETKHHSLQFITSVFTHCQNYQKHMFHEMLKALDSFEKSVYLLDTCELKPGCKIHTLTLLLLHLIQSVAHLPFTDDHVMPMQLNWDVIIAEKCKLAHALVTDIMYQLCSKWVSMKNTGACLEYKIIVENVVRDLLALASFVEWPAAELMLSCLANTFVTFIAKKQLDCSLSSSFLDYLTLILLKALEFSAAIKDSNVQVLVDSYSYKGANVDKEIDNDRYYSAYLMIIDHLTNKLPSDVCLTHAYVFHIYQCYEHLLSASTPLTDTPAIQNYLKRKRIDSCDEEMDQQLKKKGCKKYKKTKVKPNRDIKSRSFNLKIFLVNKLNALRELQKPYKKCFVSIDHELIIQYINTMKPVAQKFEYYLKHILKVVVSNCAVQLRTRAMKCISMLVGADPELLGNYLVHKFINRSFLDSSIAVREAAIDLIGVQFTNRPHLINDYYETLSARILDTGISVRKRVIHIFQSICSKYPDFSERSQMYCKLLRRLNDETVIQNQVISIFQNIWFTPVSATDDTALLEKIRTMVDVMDQLKNDQLFEKLLSNFFATERSEHSEVGSSQSVLTACEQIVDCLVKYITKCKDNSEKVVLCVEPCLKMLCAFAKVKPQLLVKHTNDFVPYLSGKVRGETQNIINIIFILECVVPTVKNPNVEFIRKLETELLSLSVHPDLTVVEKSVACLAPIVTNISHSYSLITYLLKKCHTVLLHTMQKDSQVEMKSYTVQRSLYMVGLLFRYFDFSDKKNISCYEIPENIQELVFKSCLYFARALDDSVRAHALNAIGLVCVRCNDFLLNSEIQALYTDTLSNGQASVTVKVKVLRNIDLFLEQDEKQICKKEAESRDVEKERNIKEVDMACSTASKIIQLYLQPILECYLNRNETIRFTVYTVVKRVLDQGLLHPAQIVPSLIAMSTDDRLNVYANDQLKLIELKYPGFIHMRAMVGVKLAYRLQTEVLKENSVVRGFDETKGWPRALHGFLFANFRSQLQRRAFLTSMLKRFQEPKTSLAEMLYLADNIAQLPFSMQDELQFVVNNINNVLPLTGNNVLEAFQQALLPQLTEGQNTISLDGDESEEEENEAELMQRIPEDISCFEGFATSLYGCLLLLNLKKHLMTCYGLADATFSQFTPSKSFDKKILIKRKLKFNPNSVMKIIQGENEVNDPQLMIANYLELKRLMIEVDSKEE